MCTAVSGFWLCISQIAVNACSLFAAPVGTRTVQQAWLVFVAAHAAPTQGRGAAACVGAACRVRMLAKAAWRATGELGFKSGCGARPRTHVWQQPHREQRQDVLSYSWLRCVRAKLWRGRREDTGRQFDWQQAWHVLLAATPAAAPAPACVCVFGGGSKGALRCGNAAELCSLLACVQQGQRGRVGGAGRRHHLSQAFCAGQQLTLAVAGFAAGSAAAARDTCSHPLGSVAAMRHITEAWGSPHWHHCVWCVLVALCLWCVQVCTGARGRCVCVFAGRGKQRACGPCQVVRAYSVLYYTLSSPQAHAWRSSCVGMGGARRGKTPRQRALG